MVITYAAVQTVVQLLINKGLAEQDAKDFMADVLGLSMNVEWQELRTELRAKYPNIVKAVESHCRVPEHNRKAE